MFLSSILGPFGHSGLVVLSESLVRAVIFPFFGFTIFLVIINPDRKGSTPRTDSQFC